MTNSVSHVKKTQIKLSERQRHHLSSLVPSFVCSLKFRPMISFRRTMRCCNYYKLKALRALGFTTLIVNSASVYFFVYLRFIDEGQRLSQCCERFTSTAGFSGMWTLNNKGRYNLEKFRKRRERLLAEEQPGDLEVIWL